MIKALVIADDFTGALDTGVKFSAAGASTKISLNTTTDFFDAACDVLVLCAPTRHLQPQAAYNIIRPIAERAIKTNVPCIVKKTDSALRGNIGAELQAILDGTGGKAVHFVPAFPAMNRITIEGIHYIGDVPVAESVFGKDPFEPVAESHVPSLLGMQCSTPVVTLPFSESTGSIEYATPHICLYDCSSEEQMAVIAARLFQYEQPHLLAGCAGLAESLPPHLGLSGLQKPSAPSHSARLAVICGSLNPISEKQLYRGEKAGYPRFHLSSRHLTAPEDQWLQTYPSLLSMLRSACGQAPRFIIDSFPDADANTDRSILQPSADTRDVIAHRIGMLLKGLIDQGLNSRILIIGGDTLLGFLQALDCQEITPVCELQQGVVLSHLLYHGAQYEIVSKSGGFGSEDLLENL